MADGRSPGPTGFADIDLDTALTLLRHGRCRATLRALDAADGRLARDDLATAVAARLPATDDTANDVASHARVLAALHHTTLPRLERFGVVDYDDDSGSVTLQSDAAPLLSVLDDIGHVDGTD